MYKFKKNSIILVVLTGLTLLSCKKYPDVPMFSMRSKTEKRCNTWNMKTWIQNGYDKTSDLVHFFI